MLKLEIGIKNTIISRNFQYYTIFKLGEHEAIRQRLECLIAFYFE